MTDDLIEKVTKAILVADCGSNEDWKDNTYLGEEALKAIPHAARTGELLAALQAILPWLDKAIADNAFHGCAAPLAPIRVSFQARQLFRELTGRDTPVGEG